MNHHILKNLKNEFHKSRILVFVTFSFFMAATFSFLAASHPINTSAAPVQGFNPGNIISDAVMADYTSMTVADIQAFLTSKNSCKNTDRELYEYQTNTYKTVSWHWSGTADNGHFVCLSEELFGEGTTIGSGQTAAEIIYEAAQASRINPKVLLVLLEKEQGLISDTFPHSGQYRAAMGYGCPDTAACDSKYYGFKNQVLRAAELFRYTLDNGYYLYPENKPGVYVAYNPSSSCGGTNVLIENRATAALYRYTPYQPNAAALAAGYGQGDACSAYGNRNFYLYFTDWFGSTQAKVDADPLTIPSGEYSLVPRASAERALGLSGTNAQLVNLGNNDKSQRWQFERDASSNSYKITNLSTGKVLDLNNNSTSAGTNIQTWSSDDSCGQRWKLYRNADESVTIESACASGMVLDMYGGATTAGTNVQLWLTHGGNSQKWNLYAGQTISDGIYAISTQAKTTSVIDIHSAGTEEGTNIEVFPRHDGLAQRWLVQYDADRDAYTFTNPNSNKVLSLENITPQSGRNILLRSNTNSCANYWKILQNGESYSILSTCRYGFLAAISDTNNGTNLHLSTAQQTNFGQWNFNRLSQPIPDGIYNIVSKRSNTLALDVTNADTNNGANVEIWDHHGGVPQQWVITYNRLTDDYNIIDKHSGKSLDPYGGQPISGSNINIWDHHGQCGQRWRFIPTSGDYYSILSSCDSNYSVDLYGGFTVRGTNIQLFRNNSTDNQQWKFVPDA